MWRVYLFAVCLLEVLNVGTSQVYDGMDTELVYNPLKVNFQRCTRRYTPGTCTEPVEVVWTFVFNLQNCTERLGCVHSSLTNRFSRYSSCIRRCRPVAELYAHMLEFEGTNVSDADALRNSTWGRRTGDDFIPPESDPPSDDEDTGDQPLWNPDGDSEVNTELDDVLPPNVDYVQGLRLPDREDLFHPFPDYDG